MTCLPQLSHWPAPPENRPLQDGQVHIYLLNLDDENASAKKVWAYLSIKEQEKASRFRTADLRRRYRNAHAQLRQILAYYLSCSPSEIQFNDGAHGKPSLPPEVDLRFNLSHSLDRGLAAVCKKQEVGIDIEHWRENIDRNALAQRFFTQTETAAIAAQPSNEQNRAFFNCWTRKEAYIKALGGGLSIPLDSFEVSVAAGNPVSVISLPSEHALSQIWSIYDIHPGEGYSAALAVEGAASDICCWAWSG